MNSPGVSFLFRDRRFWLFLLSAALALQVGFFAIPGLAAIQFVSKTGYWFELVAFLIFGWACWRAFRDDLRALRWHTVDWPSVGIVGLGGLILIVHETFGFKIVMDEIMLLGTSMSMHFDKTVLTPTRGNDIQGAFVILDGMMDKRPLFFPFLLSLLHDVLGYRPANAFILNGLLTFVFLGLVNRCGRILSGRRAGWLGVLLFAGLPLLGQNATGGGFELLNLVMIIATLLSGVRFIARRDSLSLTVFCYSALLLGQVRYESLLYAVPVGMIVLWIWFQERRVILSWPVIFAPLLLLPYPLQHRIFELRESSWQLISKPEYTKPFDLSFIPENLMHAAVFFFGKSTNQPTSLALAVLGWLAVPFFILLAAKRIRSLRNEPPAVTATVLFAVGFILQFVLMMAYFWGKFDDPIIRRLSLPTCLGLVIAVMAVASQFGPRFQRLLLGIAALGIITSGIPSMAAHAYTQEYLPGREVAWRREFMQHQPRPDYLMIDNDSILWVTHQVSATPVRQALARRDAVEFHFRNHTFSGIYIFQRLNVDEATGALSIREGDDLGPDFVLEPVAEQRLQALTLSRISRLTAIRPKGSVAKVDDSPPVMPKSRAEIERLRLAYLKNFLKQLP